MTTRTPDTDPRFQEHEPPRVPLWLPLYLWAISLVIAFALGGIVALGFVRT